jgi:hypothetical protein
MRRANWLGTLGLVALLVATGAPHLAAQGASPDPLARLAVEDGYLSWDGLRVGMSLVQAERKIGVTLALDRNRDQPCPVWVANAEFHGQSVTVGFPSPKPGAKIQWIQVRFRGALVQAGSKELVPALHSRLPAAVWVPPADHPDLTEADDLQPDYTLEGKEPQALRLAPREWLVLSTRPCIG